MNTTGSDHVKQYNGSAQNTWLATDPSTCKNSMHGAYKQPNEKHIYIPFKCMSLKLLRKNICCLHLCEIEIAALSALNTMPAMAPIY